MEFESTLRVIDKSQVTELPGVVEGQTVQPLVGVPEFPSERVRVAVATFKPGTHEELHWHAIEVFYYVMAGSATVRDYHGREYPVSAGSAIYAPPGIAGAHEWEVKEALQILAVRATTESDKKMQFTIDKKTKRSYIDLDELAKRGGISFKSHY